MVVFDADKHTYFNPETKRFYTSVSTLISLYKEKFDQKKHAERVAKREGVPTKEIIERWAKNTQDACDRGQDIHTLFENYIKYDIVDDIETIKLLAPVFDKNDYIKINSEFMVYHDEYEIAGTSDLICDVDREYFDVLDFKTNKKFTFFNKYKQHLKTPLNHLQQCQYNDYSIQLSLYAYLYSNLTGKKVRKLGVLYYNGVQFSLYPVPYLFWDVSVLLKHYTANHKQT